MPSTITTRIALSALLVAATAGVAAAQPSATPVADCQCTPPTGTPAAAPSRLSVGLALTSTGLSDAELASEEVDPASFGGATVWARYRLARRLSLGAELGAMHSGPEDAIERELAVFGVEALVHVTPYHDWDVYGVAALGTMHERAGAPHGSMTTGEEPSTDYVTFAVGAGIAYNVGSWQLAGELRALGARLVEDSAPPVDMIERYAGGQVRLLGAYRF